VVDNKGMMIFDESEGKPYYNDGTGWFLFGSGTGSAVDIDSAAVAESTDKWINVYNTGFTARDTIKLFVDTASADYDTIFIDEYLQIGEDAIFTTDASGTYLNITSNKSSGYSMTGATEHASGIGVRGTTSSTSGGTAGKFTSTGAGIALHVTTSSLSYEATGILYENNNGETVLGAYNDSVAVRKDLHVWGNLTVDGTYPSDWVFMNADTVPSFRRYWNTAIKERMLPFSVGVNRNNVQAYSSANEAGIEANLIYIQRLNKKVNILFSIVGGFLVIIIIILFKRK
jgi:hypothetical protein